MALLFSVLNEQLTSFDFDYTTAVALIRGKYIIFF